MWKKISINICKKKHQHSFPISFINVQKKLDLNSLYESIHIHLPIDISMWRRFVQSSWKLFTSLSQTFRFSCTRSALTIYSIDTQISWQNEYNKFRPFLVYMWHQFGYPQDHNQTKIIKRNYLLPLKHIVTALRKMVLNQLLLPPHPFPLSSGCDYMLRQDRYKYQLAWLFF